MVKLKIKKIHPDAKLPSYAHEGDAGLDVFSCEDYVLGPGERKLFKTGVSVEFDKNHVALVWDKSGLAAKKGIKTMAGVIDCGYRGEWMITLLNTSNEDHEVKIGDKIAQVLIQPVVSANIEEVKELNDSSRGEGGFGSTGR